MGFWGGSGLSAWEEDWAFRVFLSRSFLLSFQLVLVVFPVISSAILSCFVFVFSCVKYQGLPAEIRERVFLLHFCFAHGLLCFCRFIFACSLAN